MSLFHAVHPFIQRIYIARLQKISEGISIQRQ